jgi:hypothetical protein
MEDWEAGGHTMGHNTHSIGICWIGGANGKNNITIKQYKSLLIKCMDIKLQIPGIKFLGHNETTYYVDGKVMAVNKACPIIDMTKFRMALDQMVEGYLNINFILTNAMGLIKATPDAPNPETPMTGS